MSHRPTKRLQSEEMSIPSIEKGTNHITVSIAHSHTHTHAHGRTPPVPFSFFSFSSFFGSICPHCALCTGAGDSIPFLLLQPSMMCSNQAGIQAHECSLLSSPLLYSIVWCSSFHPSESSKLQMAPIDGQTRAACKCNLTVSNASGADTQRRGSTFRRRYERPSVSTVDWYQGSRRNGITPGTHENINTASMGGEKS